MLSSNAWRAPSFFNVEDSEFINCDSDMFFSAKAGELYISRTQFESCKR